jgi:hypothetical protein
MAFITPPITALIIGDDREEECAFHLTLFRTVTPLCVAASGLQFLQTGAMEPEWADRWQRK